MHEIAHLWSSVNIPQPIPTPMAKKAATCCGTLGGDNAFGGFQMRGYRSVHQTTQTKGLIRNMMRGRQFTDVGRVPNGVRSMKKSPDDVMSIWPSSSSFMEQNTKGLPEQQLRTHITSVSVIADYSQDLCSGLARTRQAD